MANNNPGKQHIVVLSIHPLYDTRVANHLSTLVLAEYDVTYVNWSKGGSLPKQEGLGNLRLIQSDRPSAVEGKVVRYFTLLVWFVWQVLFLRAELVHIHDLLLLPVCIPLRLVGKKVVFDVHEDYLNYGGRVGDYARSFYRFCLPFVNGLVGVSYKVLPTSNKPIAVVPNYQARQISPGGRPPKELHEPIEVVYFGSLSSEDREVSLMLEIAEMCLLIQGNIIFKFGGRLGGAELESNLKRLQHLSVEYPGRFVWYGEMKREHVIQESLSADFGLWLLKDSLNLIGSSPNKIYEYLTVGAIMVATEGFEISDEIRQKNAGLLFPPGVDSTTVSEAILQVAKDRNRLEHMKEASALLGLKYSWEDVAGRYLQLYDELGVS